MSLLLVTQLLALAALLVCAALLVARVRWMAARPLPAERAPARGEPQAGVLYAFTLGMLPWAKESTRRHPIAYLRGIGFHLGIFAALAALFTSPLWGLTPRWLLQAGAVLVALGALLGAAGEVMRWVEHNLRVLSTPDDHASVLLVTLFQALTAAALWSAAWLPAMYLAAAAMLLYAPLGKIRHCLYFFFSRRFFGLFLGRRAVLHTHPAEVKP